MITYSLDKLPNKMVLHVFELGRRYLNHISEKMISDHAADNIVELNANRKRYFSKDSYIENQSRWENVRFGNGKKSSMAYSGCEIIATYNALNALGEQVSVDLLAELISAFEKDGAVNNGDWGIAPLAIYDYFRKNGYETVYTDKRDPDIINQTGKEYDTVIVTVFNDKTNIMEMVHTVCITRTENDHYVIHNGRDASEFPLLYEAITKVGPDSVPICVMGINKKECKVFD